ncbi:MAG: ArsR family transcriptional regulator [Thermoplasmata archaeon]
MPELFYFSSILFYKDYSFPLALRYRINFRDIEIEDTELKRSLFWLLIASRGGDTRIKILSLILNNPMNKNELSKSLGLNYRTVTHHLNVLIENNLIREDQKYGGLVYVNEVLEGELKKIIGKLLGGNTQ